MSKVEYLYRYEVKSYSVVIDPDRAEYGSTGPTLIMRKYKVLKETSCGYWIDHVFSKRWVSKTSRKRFAYDTLEGAAEGFRQRKLAHVRHCKNRLSDAQDALRLIELKIRGEFVL